MGDDKQCDPNCNQKVGCVAIMSLKEELQEHNIAQARSQAQSSERLNQASEKVEQMVVSFEKCLVSIEDHALTLNNGRHEFKRLEEDINSVAVLVRAHTQSPEGDHPTHRSLEKLQKIALKRIKKVQGGIGAAIIVIYLVVWASPIGDFLMDAVTKKFLGVTF